MVNVCEKLNEEKGKYVEREKNEKRKRNEEYESE